MSALFPEGRLGVKICGVTNPEDAQLAVEAGADAVGINLFRGSKRFVELDAVRDWVAEIPITKVAVVVNPDGQLVAQILESDCFDAIQFHGDESPEFCAASPLPWIRAVRVSGPQALADALAYNTSMLLLDAAAMGAYGGSGAKLDWNLAAEFVNQQTAKSIILAGGLTPDNVADAVEIVRPAVVDVATGVELAGNSRHKDPEKVHEFVAAAKSV